MACHWAEWSLYLLWTNADFMPIGPIEKITVKFKSIILFRPHCGVTHLPCFHCRLLPHIKGNVGFVFTRGDLTEVRQIIMENKVAAPAKAGAIAPDIVKIPPQNTGLGPEKTSFFQALNIPTKISRGTIEILVSWLNLFLSLWGLDKSCHGADHSWWNLKKKLFYFDTKSWMYW